MGRLAWYKAEPRAFLEATRGWPFELKSAYRLVLDLIYDHDGRLVDDERYVAGEMGCDLRVWRRLKCRLLELGKLFVEEGFIRNPRADRDVHAALARLNQTVTAGVASGEKRRKSETKSSVSNGSGGTPVATPAPTTDPTIKIEIREDSESNHDKPESHEPPQPAASAPEPPPLPDLKAATWRALVGLLGPSSRSLIGQWFRDYGDAGVFDAYNAFRAASAAGEKAEPKAYLIATLQRQAGTRRNDRSPMASYARVMGKFDHRQPRPDDEQRRLMLLEAMRGPAETETVQ